MTVHAQDGTPTDVSETEVDIPPPTEPPVIEETPEPTATEIPVVEEPTSTPPPLPPTEEPTSTPTETPPAPTVAPAIPFDPELRCQRRAGSAPAVEGEAPLGWLECWLAWATPDTQHVSLTATLRDSGWHVIAIEAQALDDPDQLAVATNQLELHDADAGDAGFFTAHFFLGSSLACGAPLATTIDLSLAATSGAPDQTPVVETVQREVDESGSSATPPVVTLQSVSFAPIANSLASDLHSTGELVLSLSDAPARCGWIATITFGDFTAGDSTISAGNLTASGLTGDFVPAYSSNGGEITLSLGPSIDAQPESGTISVQLDLALSGFVPQGTYSTTVTVSSAPWNGW